MIKRDQSLRICLELRETVHQKHLATDERVNKMQYTHTMEYYLSIQRNEVLQDASILKTLCSLCEKSQS